MGNVTPIFIFNSLDTIRGGLTKAVLTRANALIDTFPQIYIFTLKYQKNHEQIINKLYESGKLDRRVKVLNMFVDIDPFKEKEKVTLDPKIYEIKEDGFVEFKDNGSKELSFRYYKNGLYVKYKRFDKKNRLMLIDYMNEGRHRIRREEYNQDGTLSRVQHMDLFQNKPKLERYMSKNGECFLSLWIDPKTGKGGRCQLYYPHPIEFKNLNELYSFWITEKIKKIDNPILMTDSRKTDEILLNVTDSKCKRIAILHNNHFAKPYTAGSDIKATWKPLFNNIEKFDKVVFLTNEQKNDVSERFGKHNHFTVIPHSVIPTYIDPKITFNPYLAVTLARYEEQKRLDEAIHAFKYVVDAIPTAEYHIYGFGPDENKLKELIEKLNLNKNVFLKGFTDNPTSVYQSASCSILTSDYEGFGLVITESLAAGTPVIAYDIKYGPKDIIRNGIDGYLVPKGDQKQLAEKIIKIMTNQDLRNQFSQNASEVVKRFSYEMYRQKWVELFKEFKDDTPQVETKQSKKTPGRFWSLFKK
ncbi:glycosyltransferase [Weizmannia acidilactici]|uniref:glycosyltransferase n=1 Tax=Weizmannia acidilactici TaxID=2607726 RepID=UPI00127C1317|nr:glycosyltransferase [Weizmannia acidilactici]GER72884.1 putative poly(glycerol-phosphate) alpha-glucosyltransferase [Weizmannia acidilactici]